MVHAVSSAEWGRGQLGPTGPPFSSGGCAPDGFDCPTKPRKVNADMGEGVLTAEDATRLTLGGDGPRRPLRVRTEAKHVRPRGACSATTCVPCRGRSLVVMSLWRVPDE